MMSWKEQHYARAEQFVRLLRNALDEWAPAPQTAPALPPPASPAPGAAPAPPAPPPPAPTDVAPVTPPPAPAAVAPAPKPPGPTAASVFKSIPWKK